MKTNFWERFTAAKKALYDEMEKRTGRTITAEERSRIEHKIASDLNYVPRIGLFGKTGVGKSSLCNALYGESLCEVDDIKACTREKSEILLEHSVGRGIKLVDVPGVGEDAEHDKDYAKMYQELLPELDVVLWLLKGDDRAFSTDESFYKTYVKPHLEQGKPFFFVISQVDKIEPFREWDEQLHEPGARQRKNIEAKCEYVRTVFEVRKDQVLAVSAEEEYGLMELMDAVVDAVPNEKKITVIRNARTKVVSVAAHEKAERGFLTDVAETIGDVVDVARNVAGEVVEGVASVVTGICEGIGNAVSSVVSCITGGGCYITTAVCDFDGKPDDCYELTRFRAFRDTWLAAQPDGPELIRRYYAVAPRIVSSIMAQPEYGEILSDIRERYLMPCLSYIEQGRNQECRDLYVEMVETMEKRFGEQED